MNYFGISKRNGCLYEGDCGNGIPVLDNPLLLPVSFVNTDYKLPLTDTSGLPNHVFREDFFDPITKVRRGRIYRAAEKQPIEWKVQDFRRSDLKIANWSDGTAQKVELISYQHDPLNYLRKLSIYPEVILGKEPFISIWKIISIESSISDTPILTLKSYRSFGSIPTLLDDKVPELILSKLKKSLDKVENSANRLGPTDIVDRCRDALSMTFGHMCGEPSKDLGKALEAYVRLLNKNKDNLISWAGRIVARLHSRGKPNEQHKNGLQELSEEDAQLALRCLWLVLVELGWAVNS